MKKTLTLLLALLLLAVPLTVLRAEEAPFAEGETVAFFESDSLRYTVTFREVGGCDCYLTEVWMLDPGAQIRKATAVWEENLLLPSEMAAAVPGAVLAVNGSGYVSPVYPEIPENYPGVSEDYWYTPLGSLTVTDGVIFRHLEGVPYYGLTLEKEGLRLYRGEAPEKVLENGPTQTWSFYEGCPMAMDHESVLDREWHFAAMKAMRTIIAKKDDHTYLLLTAAERRGLSLNDALDFLMEEDPEWVYDLDGGPSSALLALDEQGEGLRVLWGNTAKDADVMVFTELPAEAWEVE